MDRKSRYSASVRDRVPSVVAGDTSRNSKENFASEFLKYCEEYTVEPLPKLVVKGTVDVRLIRASSQQSTEDTPSPIFHLTYEGKKQDAPTRIESKDEYFYLKFYRSIVLTNSFVCCIARHEVSICILDALNSAMQKYNTITVLKLPDSRINAFGVMQIAEMMTTIGCLRDLDLDMNPNAQENFHLLCQPAGNLLFLTLRHCEISDEGAKKIANELQYRDPPNDPKLISLSLSNNRVTCEGAAHFGSMLRTNRSLRCLSLLANRMCDDGAWAIIKELKITTLEHEEIMDLRRKRFEELASPTGEFVSKESNNSTEEKGRKNNKSRSVRSLSRRSKLSITDVSIKALRTGSVDQDPLSTRKKKAAEDYEKHHPFKTESFPINGMLVSTGNLCLQYLDLSYNHLTKYTLRDLINCLYYQNFLLAGDTSMGLLHVLLEGGGFETEDQNNWTTFEELLSMRRNNNTALNNAFEDFVSPESKILREKIKASENAAENSSNNFGSSTLDE